jgi:hypothetical protein
MNECMTEELQGRLTMCEPSTPVTTACRAIVVAAAELSSHLEFLADDDANSALRRAVAVYARTSLETIVNVAKQLETAERPTTRPPTHM